MAIKTVTFDDKQNLNTNSEIARINKVIDDDINQLKDVANTNANNVGDMEQLDIPYDSIVGALNGIAEIVTNSNGTAIKYSNGIMICSGFLAFNELNIVNFGSLYRTVSAKLNDFSVPFTELFSINYGLKNLTNISDGASILQVFMPTNLNPGNVSLLLSSNTKKPSGTLTYTAIGKWK